MTTSAAPVPASSNTLSVPHVAIIGMEGAGKTVLLATLAKRLGGRGGAGGVLLDPVGVKTLKYVEQVWSTLQSGEWPPSTPPGSLVDLRWTLHAPGGLTCDVRVADPAGQDLRLLFEQEQIATPEALPAALAALAGYCRDAEIVIFLLNLRDLVGTADPARRVANEAALKAAMDYLGNDGSRRVCLVLTQADLYQGLADDKGGWLELTAEVIPYVFATHLRVRQVAVFPVAAVAGTTVVIDDDGVARRVPEQNFVSTGLDELTEWLVGQVRAVAAERSNPRLPPTVRATLPVPRFILPKQYKQWGILAGVPGLLLLLALARGCGGGNRNGTATAVNTPPPPPPPQLSAQYHTSNYLSSNNDVWIKNTSSVTLTHGELRLLDNQQQILLTLPFDRLDPDSTQSYVRVSSMFPDKFYAATAVLRCDQGTVQVHPYGD